MSAAYKITEFEITRVTYAQAITPMLCLCPPCPHPIAQLEFNHEPFSTSPALPNANGHICTETNTSTLIFMGMQAQKHIAV